MRKKNIERTIQQNKMRGDKKKKKCFLKESKTERKKYKEIIGTKKNSQGEIHEKGGRKGRRRSKEVKKVKGVNQGLRIR